MKNSLKSGVVFAVLATTFVLISIHLITKNNSVITEKDGETFDKNMIVEDSPTMGSIQNDLIEYLRKNHPEIRFGSKKFIEYANGVCMEDIDPELAQFSNYEDIQFYCAEYLHELDEQQIKGMIPFVGFKPSREFESKTIEEIKNEVREKEKLDEIEYQKVQSQKKTDSNGIENK